VKLPATVIVALAGVPGIGSSVSENVPDAPVAESEATETVPLPWLGSACHADWVALSKTDATTLFRLVISLNCSRVI
jgi:hypothetical protein